MAGNNETKRTVEERVELLEKDLSETKQFLGVLLAYLRMHHDFDAPDFMKWCHFQSRLSGDKLAEFSLFHTMVEITEGADMALEAQEGRISYRDTAR